MNVDIEISTTDTMGRAFVTWAPVKATARARNVTGAGPVAVTLSNGGPAGGGQFEFRTGHATAALDQLPLSLPANGAPVDFWIAGKFQKPSQAYGDAAVAAKDAAGAVVGQRDGMVRIRKDATTLTSAERDRFLKAMGKLNKAGTGPFRYFREMHVDAARQEAHGGPAFPPWHRAYLLDLERELQVIDAEVTLPYWRFDKPAPSLFAPAFLGMPPPSPAQGNLVQLSANHPLLFWKTDGLTGIERRPWYNIAGAPPVSVPGQGPWVISEQSTINASNLYAAFRQMEGAPHGSAHSSFDGPINSIPTAARDPLFFLLHANVDRLWAKWQWFYHRQDGAQASAFTGGSRVGHRLNDTMWPWNGVTTSPRPNFVVGGTLAPSPITTTPGNSPTVASMIDYQATRGGDPLGFDYDDVPYQP